MRGALVGVLLLALPVGTACRSDATPAMTPAATSTATEPTAASTVRPSPTPIPSPRQTATPVRELDPPYLEHFAAGEVIDVSPAVVFVDTETGDAEAWVIPGALSEFAVGPSGSYIVYLSGSLDDPQRHLLRTDDGADRGIVADAWPGPLTFGPGDTGFVATTQDGTVLTAFDGFGNSLGDLWRGTNTGPMIAAWSPDGSQIAIAGFSEDSLVLRASIREVDGEMVNLIETGLDTSYSPVALDWSPDSEKVALVSTLGVHVFGRAGALLWQYATKDLRGNPRWSPDSHHLYVYATTPISGGERPDAYLFDSDGEVSARVLAGGACAGDPWIADGSGFHIVRYWMNDGHQIWLVESEMLIEDPDPAPSPDLAVYGVEVSADIGHDYSHLWPTTVGGDLETILFTADGRFIFTTPSGGGRGGCATGAAAVLPPLEIERPPFEETPN